VASEEHDRALGLTAEGIGRRIRDFLSGVPAVGARP